MAHLMTNKVVIILPPIRSCHPATRIGRPDSKMQEVGEYPVDIEIVQNSSSLSEHDSVSLSELLSDSYLEYSEIISSDSWADYKKDILDVKSRIGDGKEQIIMRDSNKKIVGCVSLYKGSTDKDENKFPANCAYVRLLAIHPHVRGKGLGKHLMQFCSARSKLQGLQFMVRGSLLSELANSFSYAAPIHAPISINELPKTQITWPTGSPPITPHHSAVVASFYLCIGMRSGRF